MNSPTNQMARIFELNGPGGKLLGLFIYIAEGELFYFTNLGG
jgi:hypothetical protein